MVWLGDLLVGCGLEALIGDGGLDRYLLWRGGDDDGWCFVKEVEV